MLIEDMVASQCDRQGLDRSDFRFSRRDVRRHTGWGDTQLKVHLKRLVDLEHLLVHRGGRGQSFAYELLHGMTTEPGAKRLAGLIDVQQLRRRWSASNGERSSHGRGLVGAKPASGHGLVTDTSAEEQTTKSPSPADALKNGMPLHEKSPAS